MRESIRVECYSGHTYAQEPRAITWRGQLHKVQRVLLRWREPPGLRFLVLTDESDRLDIQYVEEPDHWYLVGDSVPDKVIQNAEEDQ